MDSLIDRWLELEQFQNKLSRMARLLPFWEFLMNYHGPKQNFVTGWTSEEVDYMNLLWRRQLGKMARLIN